MRLGIQPIKYVTNTDGFDKYTEELERRLLILVDKATNDVKFLSQSYVPVDQGVAKASHYVVTSKGSTREEAISEAKALAATEPSRWGNQGRELAFSSEEMPLPKFHGFVCVAVIYALELEFGYISGSLNVRATNPNAQRPFLTVAVDEYRDIFIEACVAVFRDIK